MNSKIGDYATLQHLLNVSSIYKNKTSNFNNVAECHLMSQYLIASGEQVKDLEIINNSTFLKICRWCLVTFKEGMYKVSIKPEKNLKQFINKKKLGIVFTKKQPNFKNFLKFKTRISNKCQRSLVKTCLKYLNHNYLVVKCHVCRKKSTLPLAKPPRAGSGPGKPPVAKQSRNTHIEEPKPTLTKKKKKKKKDIYAGLNPSVVGHPSTWY